MPKQPIPLVNVESSQIQAVGYHPESQTLAVRFHPRGDQKTGATYHYPNVPAETYVALRDAESVGRYFGSNIRKQYAGTKIEYPA
jgi:hypothetical protein